MIQKIKCMVMECNILLGCKVVGRIPCYMNCRECDGVVCLPADEPDSPALCNTCREKLKQHVRELNEDNHQDGCGF